MSDERSKQLKVRKINETILELQKCVENGVELTLEDYKNINELLEKANKILQKYIQKGI